MARPQAPSEVAKAPSERATRLLQVLAALTPALLGELHQRASLRDMPQGQECEAGIASSLLGGSTAGPCAPACLQHVEGAARATSHKSVLDIAALFRPARAFAHRTECSEQQQG